MKVAAQGQNPVDPRIAFLAHATNTNSSAIWYIILHGIYGCRCLFVRTRRKNIPFLDARTTVGVIWRTWNILKFKQHATEKADAKHWWQSIRILQTQSASMEEKRQK